MQCKMSALEELGLLPLVKKRIKSGFTHKTIVEELRAAYPGVRGISLRSLKRFCAAHDLHATSRCSDPALDVLIAYGIGLVSCRAKGICCKTLNESLSLSLCRWDLPMVGK